MSVMNILSGGIVTPICRLSPGEPCRLGAGMPACYEAGNSLAALAFDPCITGRVTPVIDESIVSIQRANESENR